MSEIILAAGSLLTTNSSSIRQTFVYSAPGAHDAQFKSVKLRFEFETAKQAEVAIVEAVLQRDDMRTSTIQDRKGIPYRLHGSILPIDVNTPLSLKPLCSNFHSKFELVLRHGEACWTELYGSALSSGALELMLTVNSPPGYLRIDLVVRTIDHVPAPIDALIEQEDAMASNDEEAAMASDDKGFESDDFNLLREHDGEDVYKGWKVSEERDIFGMSLDDFMESHSPKD